MFDFHVHTKFSYDGYEELEDFCAFAAGKKLKEICFTEHLDLLHPNTALPYTCPDMPAYLAAAEAAAKKYRGVKIRKGLEAGLQKNNLTQTSEFLKKYDLDFVIASQHTAAGGDPDFDKTLFDRYGETGYIRLYLKETAENLALFDDYDVCGHIGYAARYLSSPRPVTYADFQEELDTIIDILIEKGKGMEVNTSGLFTVGSAMPHISIVERFVSRGGSIITFGSDAHFLNVLANAWEETAAALKNIGVKRICTFKKRTAVFHALR